jgi:hypothetical protein
MSLECNLWVVIILGLFNDTCRKSDDVSSNLKTNSGKRVEKGAEGTSRGVMSSTVSGFAGEGLRNITLNRVFDFISNFETSSFPNTYQRRYLLNQVSQ